MEERSRVMRKEGNYGEFEQGKTREFELVQEVYNSGRWRMGEFE